MNEDMNKIEKIEKIEFPEWMGYKDLDKIKQLVSYGCYNDNKLILEYAAKMFIERNYFKAMLLYINNRLDKHIFLDEPLGLCLNSANEIFEGIMITPCETIGDEERKKDEKGSENEKK